MRLAFFEKQTLSGDNPALELTVSSVDDLPYHWHEDLEMMAVLKGSVLFYASTLKKRLSAGDVELISVDEIHKIKGEEDNLILSLKVRTPLAERFIPAVRDVVFDCNLHPGREAGKLIQQRFAALLCSFFLYVYESCDSDRYDSDRGSDSKTRTLDEGILGRLEEILLYIMAEFDIVNKVLKGKDLGTAERDLQRNRYRRVADFIFKNSSRRIGLRDIAERENLSLSFLSHAIKDLFGNGFQELINYQRVCTAMKLLLSTDFNITDIAFECGFSAPRYLMNRFEEFLEMKPADFRKKYRGDGKIPEALIHDVDTLSALEILKAYASDHRAGGAVEMRVPLNFKSGSRGRIDWRSLEPEKREETLTAHSLHKDDWAAALIVLKDIIDSASRPEEGQGRLSDGIREWGSGRSSLSLVFNALSGMAEELLFSASGVLVCRGAGCKGDPVGSADGCSNRTGRSLDILLLNDSGLENPGTEQDRTVILGLSESQLILPYRQKAFYRRDSLPCGTLSGTLWDLLRISIGSSCP